MESRPSLKHVKPYALIYTCDDACILTLINYILPSFIFRLRHSTPLLSKVSSKVPREERAIIRNHGQKCKPHTIYFADLYLTTDLLLAVVLLDLCSVSTHS